MSYVVFVPQSKLSILIVEDDCHISRVVRNHFEETFPEIRVTIAGSAAKAKQLLDKFQQSFIIWDGASNGNGSEKEYMECIPAAQWNRVIPISTDAKHHEFAKSKGAQHPPIPKKHDAINSWSESIVHYVKSQIPSKKK
jgi:hypothetical protein